MTTGGKSDKTGAVGFEGDENYEPGAPAPEVDPELAALLDKGLAKGWLPQPGDKVGGVLIDRYDGTSDYGEYPILEIEQSNGEVIAVHGFHRVLRSQIERKDPRLGDKVGVHYYGLHDRNRAGQSPPAMYKLVVIAAPRPVDPDREPF